MWSFLVVLLQNVQTLDPFLSQFPSEIRWYPSPNFRNRLSYMNSGNYRGITSAVIRTRGGNIKRLLGIFTHAESKASPTLTIGKDGTIYQHIKLTDTNK